MAKPTELEIALREDSALNALSQETCVATVCKIIEMLGSDVFEDIALGLDFDTREEIIEVFQRFQ